MTAHILVPALDPEYPATLSHRILTGLLRQDMGFPGLIITDQMTMQGVADRWGAPRASALAVMAGADVVLGGGTADLQIAGIREVLEAVRRGELSESRIDESALRVLSAKETCGVFAKTRAHGDRAFIGSRRSFARELAGASITLLRNDGVLPLRRGPSVRTVVAGVTQTTNRGSLLGSHVSRYSEAIEARTGGPVLPWHSSTDNPTPGEIRNLLGQVATADQVVVFTYSRGEPAGGQVELVRAVHATGRPTAVVATGTPYDVERFPGVPAYVATFMLSFVPMHLNNPYVLEAAADVMFGARAPGRLPVAIPGVYGRGEGVGG